MPWIKQRIGCSHPNRPVPLVADAGRVWECELCGGQWRVHREYYEHDVMPGEPEVGARWIEIKSGRLID